MRRDDKAAIPAVMAGKHQAKNWFFFILRILLCAVQILSYSTLITCREGFTTMATQDREGRKIGQYSLKLQGREKPPEVSKGGPQSKKAIMFVPEGVNANDADLDIEVVALDAATFEAMGPRHC
jgi:hypothetical protein